MRLHPRRQGALIGLCILGGLTAGCDAPSVTAPKTSAPATIARSDGAAALLGQTTLGPSSESLVPFAGASPDSWVIVRISGQFSAERNPACLAAEATMPNAGCPTATGISSFTERLSYMGPVRVWRQSGTSKQQLKVRAGGGGGIALMHARNAATLSARVHLSVPNWQLPGQNAIPAYFISGGYTAQALEIPAPVQLTESASDANGMRHYSLSTLHGLEFVNPTEPYYWDYRKTPNVSWRFIPDRGTPKRIGAECDGKTDCSYKPGGPGTMEVTTYVEGQQVIIRSSGLPFVQPEIRMTCPDTVIRGTEMECTAQAVPSGELTDISWEFRDDNGHVTGDSARASWGGMMVVGGRMTVSAALNGSPVSVDTAVTVKAREWTGLIPYPTALPRDSVDPSEFPIIPVTVASNGYDRWVPGALGRYEFDLDWGGKFQPINRGPNKGYWYLKDPPIWITPVVYLSGHLEPGHPFYEAQTGRRPGDRNPPRAYTAGWCTRAHMDTLRQEVREHEGSAVGSRLSHHSFNIQYTGRNDPGPAVEGILLRTAPADPFAVLADSALGAAYERALEAANNAAVHAASNIYTVPCKVHLP